MNRLAQAGIFCIVLGIMTLFLGIFPYAVNRNATPSIGLVQIVTMLAGLTFVVMGSYCVVFALVHRGRPRNLLRDIGVRLGMTGLVISSASALADVMGVGSHSSSALVFGFVQGIGMLAGFLIAMGGVLIYAIARQ